jgi:hypothetical protein
MESIPLFTGFIINVLCDLQFTEPAPYMFAPYNHTAPTLWESYASRALQSADAEFIL